MEGTAKCFCCTKKMEIIKYWTLDGGYCVRCFFKEMRYKMMCALDIMTEEEIQELFGSDYYCELYKAVEGLNYL